MEIRTKEQLIKQFQYLFNQTYLILSVLKSKEPKLTESMIDFISDLYLGLYHINLDESCLRELKEA